jgi:hypothetical protein
MILNLIIMGVYINLSYRLSKYLERKEMSMSLDYLLNRLSTKDKYIYHFYIYTGVINSIGTFIIGYCLFVLLLFSGKN